ncbi:MAG TPA: ABC transporter permease [Myxococcales bacterium]|nr:ABC transporter permease [Myxococcales bacterium]
MIPLSYNVRSILRRRFSAVATAAGLGLVVFVFAADLMLAQGVEETLQATGSPRNAIVLRKGSSTEVTSLLSREAAKVFSADPAVAMAGGKAVASPELFVVFQLPRADGNGTANVGFRGVTPDGLQLLRSETVKLIDGRWPQPATSELIIGKALRGRYKGAALGQSIHIARRDWQVVGVFEAGGSGFESEAWGDADQLIDAAHRPGYSQLTVRLKSPSEMASLRATIDANPAYNLEAKREDLYYEEASGQLAGFVRSLGRVIAFFFAFGATLGAMITMYAQVASRVREVGTLRALGFRRRAVLGSFLLESLVLALIGAVAGCTLAAAFSGVSFSTVNFSSFTEIKFRFHFAAGVGLWATVFAVAMGVLGGALPAIRAARLAIAEAIKG